VSVVDFFFTFGFEVKKKMGSKRRFDREKSSSSSKIYFSDGWTLKNTHSLLGHLSKRKGKLTLESLLTFDFF